MGEHIRTDDIGSLRSHQHVPSRMQYGDSPRNALDEQAISDPMAGSTGSPTSGWSTPWDSTYFTNQQYPSFVVDLNG